jgi:hypothetical protein
MKKRHTEEQIVASNETLPTIGLFKELNMARR